MLRPAPARATARGTSRHTSGSVERKVNVTPASCQLAGFRAKLLSRQIRRQVFKKKKKTGGEKIK
jgi:hypothetical protein